jgi:hypothetical protein
MNNRARQYSILFLLAFLLSLVISPLQVAGEGVQTENIDTAQFAQVRIEKLQQVAQTLRGLAGKPLPANLTDDEKKEAMRYTRWLISSSKKLNELASRWQNKLSDIGMIQSRVLSMQQMKEANTSFDGQYSAMRDELLSEVRQYAVIARIMKGNYDTAQDSINKLR